MTRTRRHALNLLLQLLVVVTGVTISLALDEWRAARGEARDAHALTAALASDLRADLDAIGTASDRTNAMIAAYQRLLAPEAASLPDDSLDTYVDLAVSYALLTPHDEAYEAMRQTGTSRLLRDPDLRSDVIRYHTRTLTRATEWDDINRQFILDRMIPYIEANGPELSATSAAGAAGTTAWTGLADAFRAMNDQTHFRNLVRSNLLFKQAQVSVYGATREHTTALLARIEGR